MLELQFRNENFTVRSFFRLLFNPQGFMKALIKCEFHKISKKTSHPTTGVTNLIEFHQAGSQSKLYLQTFSMNILTLQVANYEKITKKIILMYILHIQPQDSGKYQIHKRVVFVRFGNCCHMSTLGIDTSLTFFVMSDSIFLLVPKNCKELFVTLFRIPREEK